MENYKEINEFTFKEISEILWGWINPKKLRKLKDKGIIQAERRKITEWSWSYIYYIKTSEIDKIKAYYKEQERRLSIWNSLWPLKLNNTMELLILSLNKYFNINVQNKRPFTYRDELLSVKHKQKEIDKLLENLRNKTTFYYSLSEACKLINRSEEELKKLIEENKIKTTILDNEEKIHQDDIKKICYFLISKLYNIVK